MLLSSRVGVLGIVVVLTASVAACWSEPLPEESGSSAAALSGPETSILQSSFRGPELKDGTGTYFEFKNPTGTGYSSTFSTRPISIGELFANPFMSQPDNNGRACVTCHLPGEGFGMAPWSVGVRFNATSPRGTDPIFRENDGSNSPLDPCAPKNAPCTEAQKRAAYSMVLTKGLIRVGIGMPAGAEFDLVAVDDPYGFASANELSLFRRPLPTTNLAALSTVMWDGRIAMPSADPAGLRTALLEQANAATEGHSQGATLTAAQQNAVVDLELALYTAQQFDPDAGKLTDKKARGGAKALATQPNYIGINDVLAGDSRTGAPFNPVVFDVFDAWAKEKGAKAQVVRGQALFNTKRINITGVKGLNDDLNAPSIAGTCTTCHDAPNFGNHSVKLPIDIGLADASRRTPDMPLYTFRNNATGETLQVVDPGRGLITGKWKDIGKFKGAVLRGLATRPPYFHDGSAATLDAAVDFYDRRFGIGFTPSEKADLVAFLKTL
jgi:cytochrome c peroxidase